MPFLSNHEAELVLQKIAPLGRVPRYDYTGASISLSETTARRFILDASVVLRPRSNALTNPKAYDTSYLGFGFREAASTIIQDDYKLYERLFRFVGDTAKAASARFKNCEQAALLLGHSSFGQELFPHIHSRSSLNLPTLSVFFNLTSEAESILTLYSAVQESSRAFERGYIDQRVVAIAAKNSTPTKIPIKSGTCVLFDASHTPHRYTYTDDLWLVFVFDHVQGLKLLNTFDTFDL